ncbi:MAG: DUF1015 domain-containing protein [Oscillospiraceae bacterium]|nr:DUF1015 domain-containing protein [Oscillospiraceae bacterium]
MHPFQCANILLPKIPAMDNWAVIACDQFVSQPEYWQRVRKQVGESPSTLHLILPETDLEEDCSAAIASINETMRRYINEGLFREYAQCFLYVERTLLNGSVRKGVVGCVDLEQYDFSPQSQSVIRATEETVADRVPPRMDIRRGATLELPHVLVLCDDQQQRLLESLTAKKQELPLLYDFELMAGGGRIRGWLVDGKNQAEFSAQLQSYEDRMTAQYGPGAVLYAVGDGNHSLAAAKGCYEELKALGKPCEAARYALVELENIHDQAQIFEPIHRIIKDCDPQALLDALQQALGKREGVSVGWHIGAEHGSFCVSPEEGVLPVGLVQDFIDSYLEIHRGTVDYIHGQDAVQQLAEVPNTLGLILPAVDKKSFFQSIIAGGTLPRKTFSMGHAQEKRYYLEARRIG